MTDLVVYKVEFEDGKPLYCIGTSEKDIVDSITEWSGYIKRMEYVGEGYVATGAAKYSNE